MTKARAALVTGSTRGIGFAIASELCARGYRVILNYHSDQERAEQALHALREAGGSADLIRADASDAADVGNMVEDALREAPIDLLVNNVGAFHFKPFLETDAADWSHVIGSALLSAVYCSRALLPRLRDQGAGHIINIASPNAGTLRAKPNTLPYAIAKAGIVLLTKTLASTEGKFGIRVNAVSPGYVQGGDFSPERAADRIPLGRLADPSEIAKAVAFLDSEDGAYINGAVLDVHGGVFL